MRTIYIYIKVKCKLTCSCVVIMIIYENKKLTIDLYKKWKENVNCREIKRDKHDKNEKVLHKQQEEEI